MPKNKYPSQLDVLKLMTEGWQLALSVSIDYHRAWLQKGGAGFGGESLEVHGNTLNTLTKQGLIQQHYSFPTATYTITEAGKKRLEFYIG